MNQTYVESLKQIAKKILGDKFNEKVFENKDLQAFLEKHFSFSAYVVSEKHLQKIANGFVNKDKTQFKNLFSRQSDACFENDTLVFQNNIHDGLKFRVLFYEDRVCVIDDRIFTFKNYITNQHLSRIFQTTAEFYNDHTDIDKCYIYSLPKEVAAGTLADMIDATGFDVMYHLNDFEPLTDEQKDMFDILPSVSDENYCVLRARDIQHDKLYMTIGLYNHEKNKSTTYSFVFTGKNQVTVRTYEEPIEKDEKYSVIRAEGNPLAIAKKHNEKKYPTEKMATVDLSEVMVKMMHSQGYHMADEYKELQKKLAEEKAGTAKNKEQNSDKQTEQNKPLENTPENKDKPKKEKKNPDKKIPNKEESDPTTPTDGQPDDDGAMEMER